MAEAMDEEELGESQSWATLDRRGARKEEEAALRREISTSERRRIGNY